jgi:hypothetical protein
MLTSRLAVIAHLLAVFTVTMPARAEQYLCVPDKATGFVYDKNTKQWKMTKLKTSQFVISPSKDKKAAYDVKDIGEHGEGFPGWCKEDFSEYGYLSCDTFGGNIHFNKINGRFLRMFWFTYFNTGDFPGAWDKTDEDSATPMIEIGKCTAF